MFGKACKPMASGCLQPCKTSSSQSPGITPGSRSSWRGCIRFGRTWECRPRPTPTHIPPLYSLRKIRRTSEGLQGTVNAHHNPPRHIGTTSPMMELANLPPIVQYPSQRPLPPHWPITPTSRPPSPSPVKRPLSTCLPLSRLLCNLPLENMPLWISLPTYPHAHRHLRPNCRGRQPRGLKEVSKGLCPQSQRKQIRWSRNKKIRRFFFYFIFLDLLVRRGRLFFTCIYPYFACI